MVKLKTRTGALSHLSPKFIMIKNINGQIKGLNFNT